MNRHIVFLLISTLGCCLAVAFYFISERQLTKGSLEATKLILTAEQADDLLERDLLKSKDSLLGSYDRIVEDENAEEKVCSDLKGPAYSIYFSSPQLEILIHSYCEALETKIHNVELFKSRNAVLRNSLHLIHALSVHEFKTTPPQPQSPIATAQESLINSSLAFLLVSTPEAEVKLRQALENATKLKQSSDDLASISLHAMQLLKVKKEIDGLTSQILASETGIFLDRLNETYLDYSRESNERASRFRAGLLGIFLTLFLFTVYCIFSLWRAGQDLLEANSGLEQKIQERTRLVQESQRKILEQQEALITSSKMSALGEMAGGVAHEINNPLAIITMRIEQMQDCLEEDRFDKAQFLNRLAIVKKTAGRIAKIVSGLRFFAREGREGMAQVTKACSIVEETLGFCQERFASHGVHLKIVKDKTFMEAAIQCRSVEISQVLLNLLNNAFDAIEKETEKWIEVKATDLDEFIEISVTDCGKGIPKEIQDRIMTPFFTTKPIGQGTGLGLSISKGIVEGHHGKFFIDNTSRNTKFVILLPKRQPGSANQTVAP